MERRRWDLLSVVVVVALYAATASAQDAAYDNRLDSIATAFRTHAGTWTGVLRSYALRLFWLLAGIEFAWTGITLALKGADISEWLAELVNRILFIGFFLWVLTTSSSWSSAIIDSFRQAGAAASAAGGGSAAMTPSNLFDSGVRLAMRVAGALSWTHPADAALLGIGAVVILITFSLIGALLILALVESYIVISAGVLLLGFGGSRWTKDYAMKVITYCVSVGAKLFVLQLIVGIGEALVRDWMALYGEMSTSQMFVLLGCAVVVLVLAKSIPDMVQALINGTHVGTGGALMGAAAAVGGGAAAVAAGVAGGGAVAQSAYRLAREQVATGGSGGMGAIAYRTMGNIGSAAVNDIGARLSGRAHHGHMPWRMAEAMSEQAKGLKAARGRPELPQSQEPSPAGKTAANIIRGSDSERTTEGNG